MFRWTRQLKPVVIAEDGNVTIDGTAVEQIENIENDLARATIQINKVDEKNPTNPIADSTYGLYRHSWSRSSIVYRNRGDQVVP